MNWAMAWERTGLKLVIVGTCVDFHRRKRRELSGICGIAGALLRFLGAFLGFPGIFWEIRYLRRIVSVDFRGSPAGAVVRRGMGSDRWGHGAAGRAARAPIDGG